MAAGETCPWIDFLPRVHGGPGPESLPLGYRLYIGHFGLQAFQRVSRGHALCTTFRSPAQRLSSLYAYFRHVVPETEAVWSRPEYHAVRAAKTRDFEGFLGDEDPRVAVYTRDHHARMLAGDGWDHELRPSRSEGLALVEALDWFYLCEEPELSLRWARAALRAPRLRLGRENAGRRGRIEDDALVSLSRRGLARLGALIERDEEIYAAAAERFRREVLGRSAGRPASRGSSLAA